MLKPRVDTSIIVTSEFESPYGCNIAEGIWYYDLLEDRDNRPQIYKYLLSSAREKIWIWDPYTNPEDHILFKHIRIEVDVRCLTFWGSNPKKEKDIPRGRDLFLENIKRVQGIYKFGLEIRYYNTFKDSRISNPFHDRYLFIDNDIYIVGSSMGYHHENSTTISSTSIHLIREKSSIRLVKEKFLEIWNNKNTDTALELPGGFI